MENGREPPRNSDYLRRHIPKIQASQANACGIEGRAQHSGTSRQFAVIVSPESSQKKKLVVRAWLNVKTPKGVIGRVLFFGGRYRFMPISIYLISKSAANSCAFMPALLVVFNNCY